MFVHDAAVQSNHGIYESSQGAQKGFKPQYFSTIGKTSIFRCGIVIKIMPYAYFSPQLSLHFYLYFKCTLI